MRRSIEIDGLWRFFAMIRILGVKLHGWSPAPIIALDATWASAKIYLYLDYCDEKKFAEEDGQAQPSS